MRFIINSDDPYIWAVLPGKEHLFSKHINGHSIGVYKELYKGIKVIFKALLIIIK